MIPSVRVSSIGIEWGKMLKEISIKIKKYIPKNIVSPQKDSVKLHVKIFFEIGFEKF
jgi:hypothetical protein